MARSSSPTSGSRKRKCSDANNNNKRRKTSEAHQESPKKDVIKSPRDNTKYKLIVLENGIRTILISTLPPEKEKEKEPKSEPVDEATGELESVVQFNKEYIKFEPSTGKEKSSENVTKYKDISSYHKAQRSSEEIKSDSERSFGYGTLVLTVGAGSMDCPSDLPGLAHLCEHCVLLETIKSSPGVYNSWLNHIWMNNGYGNAYTAMDRTTYFFATSLSDFDGNPVFLKTTELLADCITEPLLAKDSIVKEINAVDCEFQMSTDPAALFRQFWGILLSLAKPNHPVNAFPCGNQKTLGKSNIAERLRDWKEKYYVGNSMTLAIQAPLKLEELEKIAMDNFSKIPSKSKSGSSSKRKIGKDDPFNTPAFRKVYKISTSYHLDSMIVSWSLAAKVTEQFDVLPLKYIAYVLGSQNEGSLTNYLQKKGWAIYLQAFHMTFGYCTTFHIFVILTKTGLDHYENVVESVFSYLKFLEIEKTDVGLFNELQRTKVDQFHYGRNSSIIETPLSLDYEIQNGRGIYALTADSIIMKCDPNFVDSVVRNLCPQTANYMLFSRRFKTECKLVQEKWNGIKYIASSLLDKTLKNWKNVQPCDEYQFRPRNDALLNRDLRCPKDETSSRVITNDDRAVIVHFAQRNCKPGHSYPQAYCLMRIYTNLAPSPLNTILLSLWTLILGNEIDTKFCNVQSQLSIGRSIIYFGVLCHPSQLSEVVTWTMRKFDKFESEVKESTYELFRDILLKILLSYGQNTHGLLQDLTRYILDENHNRIERVYNTLKEATFPDFLDMMKEFKTQMFVVCYFIGNISTEQADQIAGSITQMPYRHVPGGLMLPQRRGMQVPPGENCLRVFTLDPEDTMGVMNNYYEIGRFKSLLDFVLALDIAKLLNIYAFNELRTKEQLTYAVGSHFNCNNCILGVSLGIMFQGQKHSAEKIAVRINECLKTFHESYLCDENLSKLMPTQEADYFQQMRKFFGTYFLPTGNGYRKLSIQILPNSKSTPAMKSGQNPDLSLKYDSPAVTSKNNNYIRNVDFFKAEMFVYPSTFC